MAICASTSTRSVSARQWETDAAAVSPVPVAGMTKLTTVDFPDRLAAVVFLQGCPWACAYCHNDELRAVKSEGAITWGEVLAFLEKRVGLLDGVVFSGGEATMRRGLPEAMRQVRALGFEIGLHTNGAYPDRVEALIDEGLVDWVGLDIKAPQRLHGEISGVGANPDRTWRTLRLLQEYGVAHQLRTTVYRPLLDDAAVLELAAELRDAGADALSLQAFRPPEATGTVIHEEDLSDLQQRVDTTLNEKDARPDIAERTVALIRSSLTTPATSRLPAFS